MTVYDEWDINTALNSEGETAEARRLLAEFDERRRRNREREGFDKQRMTARMLFGVNAFLSGGGETA